MNNYDFGSFKNSIIETTDYIESTLSSAYNHLVVIEIKISNKKKSELYSILLFALSMIVQE